MEFNKAILEKPWHRAGYRKKVTAALCVAKTPGAGNLWERVYNDYGRYFRKSQDFWEI
jgi:hypothetical protein